MMKVKEFFDRKTSTLSYVVYDRESKDAVIIDPVWNFDLASAELHPTSAKEMVEFVSLQQLHLHYILETHIHADHVSSSQLIKKSFPQAKLLIGDQIGTVQKTFKKIYNLPDSFPTDGRQFDGQLKDNALVRAGKMEFKVLHTPGHTPACVTYLFKGMAFTGDALFMPDSGTGRCDFPGGSAHNLFHSIMNKIYTLPLDTVLYTGHDYQPGERSLQFSTTVKEQKEKNIHLKSTTTEEEYVHFRTRRDSQLSVPQLFLPSLQINIRGGRLPDPESNGVSYLKIPLKEFS